MIAANLIVVLSFSAILRRSPVDACCRENSCEDDCSDISCSSQCRHEEHCCRSAVSGNCEGDCSDISCSNQSRLEEDCCRSADPESSSRPPCDSCCAASANTTDASCPLDPKNCCCINASNTSALYNLTGVNAGEYVANLNETIRQVFELLIRYALLPVTALLVGQQKAVGLALLEKFALQPVGTVKKCALVFLANSLEDFAIRVLAAGDVVDQGLDVVS